MHQQSAAQRDLAVYTGPSAAELREQFRTHTALRVLEVTDPVVEDTEELREAAIAVLARLLGE